MRIISVSLAGCSLCVYFYNWFIRTASYLVQQVKLKCKKELEKTICFPKFFSILDAVFDFKLQNKTLCVSLKYQAIAWHGSAHPTSIDVLDW